MNSHGSDNPVTKQSTAKEVAPYTATLSAHLHHTIPHMSLPRSDYDPRRVCLNPFPDLNLNFGKHRRTIGIYLAGALVCIFSFLPPTRPNTCICIYIWICVLLTTRPYTVRTSKLDLLRRSHLIRTCPPTLRRPPNPAPRTRPLRRLGTRHLLPPRHAHHQHHRQG